MSRPNNVGANQNGKIPIGEPLKPNEVVPENDASSAAMERELEEDLDEMDEEGDAEDIDETLAGGLKFPLNDDEDGGVDAEDDEPAQA
ncbi:hypothetical protein LUX29_01100 [Aureimonas altamirensis]|uniref:hypothetical protein n=1 Tax=Aureimonas altamirensis TaxID=370622 RepID=UPI001E61DED6|nr:hypothetical protein [Aureimonas altamirensis]UHD45885.1 hypothetical protein LUX29_01100 [Aureimonas altamirensis]